MSTVHHILFSVRLTQPDLFPNTAGTISMESTVCWRDRDTKKGDEPWETKARRIRTREKNRRKKSRNRRQKESRKNNRKERAISGNDIRPVR
jgi:hypothetical protein